MKKKKLFFAAYSLDIGGIETALVTLVNFLYEKGYDITVALEKKQGDFLSDINDGIKIIEYTPSNNPVLLIRKSINLLKRIEFILKYKNRFDFAASFATYSLAGSFMAKTASKNSALWVHADYLTLYNNNEEKLKMFFDNVNCSEFKNIVFVSNEAETSFKKVYTNFEGKTLVCNNLTNYKKILEKANEDWKLHKEKEITFLNVGRHDEIQKKLTRLLDASKMLIDEGYKFKVLMVGDGKDHSLYQKMTKDYNLEDVVTFTGRKTNPYPFFKISDCLILTSEYEGYPVVFVEACVLGLPIITTNISDSKDEIDGKYGFVTEKNTQDIYRYMKKFMDEGFKIKEIFDPEKFNNEIVKKLESIF